LGQNLSVFTCNLCHWDAWGKKMSHLSWIYLL